MKRFEFLKNRTAWLSTATPTAGTTLLVSALTISLANSHSNSLLAGTLVRPLTLLLLSATTLVNSVALAENSKTTSAVVISTNQNNRVSLPGLVKNGIIEEASASEIDLRGWDHLYDLLIESGANGRTLQKLFSDPRMPARGTLLFSLEPKESKVLYRKHNTAANRKHALAFYAENRSAFIAAEKKFGVPRSVILALLQVETACGEHTGKERVFHRLARLASAAEPKNVEENFFDKRSFFKNLTVGRVKARAEILQGLFLAHVAATIPVAQQMKLYPLELKGSGAGAIGLPQFLPGNVEKFGFDGDRDGEIDVFQPTDAIFSVAKFLNAHGWKGGFTLPVAKQRSALHNYNRSEPYISTILEMAHQLEPLAR